MGKNRLKERCAVEVLELDLERAGVAVDLPGAAGALRQ
jgi:hypothetical protein